MFKDRAIALLTLGQTLVWAGIYYIFPVLLMRWEVDLGWSKSVITGAFTLAVLVSALASPIAGNVIDRGYGALLMAAAAMLGGVGVIGLAMTFEVWQFYLAWFVIGLAMAGALYEPCFAILTRARGQHAKSGIIAITLVAGFASTVSYPAVYLLSETLGWRATCLIIGVIVCLVVAPMLWAGARQLERARAHRGLPADAETAARTGFLKQPAFWFLAVGFAFFAVSHGGILHHLLPILNERGVSPELAVLAASLIGPMQVAGRLGMMAATRLISNHAMAITAFLVIALSVLTLLLGGASPALILGFVTLFGSGYGTVSILRPVLAREILGEDNFGAKSGALALPYLAGSAMAPLLASLIWARGGYDIVLLVFFCCLAVGCVLYVSASRLSWQRG